MDAEVGSKTPGTSSGPPSRWTPVVTWLLSVTAVPVVLLGIVWAHRVVGLPFLDSGRGVLDQVVPPVTILAFVACLISIWRSSTTVVMKIVVTLATIPVLIAAIMMALVVIFWGFVTTSA